MMNQTKHLKPNLLDPILEKKIINTLNPPQDNYWEPTKNIFHNIYKKYIRPNITLVIIFIIILLLLLYRYRIIKNKRVNKLDNDQQIIDEYTNYFIESYNQQKEDLREPIKTDMSRIDNKKPSLAYPMYPYNNSGILLPSNKTR